MKQIVQPLRRERSWKAAIRSVEGGSDEESVMTLIPMKQCRQGQRSTQRVLPLGRLTEISVTERPVTSGNAKSASLWHVLHTRSRQEKSLARVLHAAGIEYYLPVVDRVRFYGHRKRTVTVPLFSNYLFVNGSLEVAYFATSTHRVANVIPVLDQEGFASDLEQIRRALSGGADLSPYRYLEIGLRVRVTSGPFRDIEGLIENHHRPDRLILQIDTLGRAASLEIDASLLELVD
ncbi:MAG: UpxY family transcription antiterminator [Planctomycetes bacterium]|nr:UpxY family transcription antiterminator [Planctomycetota bacterium]